MLNKRRNKMIKAGDLFYFVNRSNEIEVVAVTSMSQGVWHFQSENNYGWDNYSEEAIVGVLSTTRTGAVQLVIDRLNKTLADEKSRYEERISNLSGNIAVMNKIKESAEIGYDAESDKATAFSIMKEVKTKVIEKGLASLKSWGIGEISMSDMKDGKVTIVIDTEK
jgi:hypothetical protein